MTGRCRRLCSLSSAVLTAMVLVGCAEDHGGGANHDAAPGGGGAANGAGAGGANAGGPGVGLGGGAGISGNRDGNAGGGARIVDAAADGYGPPVDNRPPRPAWNPPFPVGPPGWQNSTTPICEQRQGGLSAYSVWADQRGVFTVLSDVCQVVGRDLPSCTAETERVAGTSIQFNDGTGWRSIDESPTQGYFDFTGFPEGPLVVAGGDPTCGISFVNPEQGVKTCTASLDGSFPHGVVFVVNALLAYAIDGQRVLRWTGAWQTLATLSEPVASIWADEDTVIVGGYNQAVFRKAPGSDDFTPLSGAPVGDYVSVWSLGPNDTWFGNTAGQLIRYDGAAWHIVPTGVRLQFGNGIAGLWGMDGQLYFQSELEFGRWNGQSVELLLTLPNEGGTSSVSFNGLWGRSPSEVFLTMTDVAFDKFACGGHFMVWFDGSQFRLF